MTTSLLSTQNIKIAKAIIESLDTVCEKYFEKHYGNNGWMNYSGWKFDENDHIQLNYWFYEYSPDNIDQMVEHADVKVSIDDIVEFGKTL